MIDRNRYRMNRLRRRLWVESLEKRSMMDGSGLELPINPTVDNADVARHSAELAHLGHDLTRIDQGSVRPDDVTHHHHRAGHRFSEASHDRYDENVAIQIAVEVTMIDASMSAASVPPIAPVMVSARMNDQSSEIDQSVPGLTSVSEMVVRPDVSGVATRVFVASQPFSALDSIVQTNVSRNVEDPVLSDELFESLKDAADASRQRAESLELLDGLFDQFERSGGEWDPVEPPDDASDSKRIPMQSDHQGQTQQRDDGLVMLSPMQVNQEATSNDDQRASYRSVDDGEHAFLATSLIMTQPFESLSWDAASHGNPGVIDHNSFVMSSGSTVCFATASPDHLRRRSALPTSSPEADCQTSRSSISLVIIGGSALFLLGFKGRTRQRDLDPSDVHHPSRRVVQQASTTVLGRTGKSVSSAPTRCDQQAK